MQVNWGQAPILGDEKDIGLAVDRQKRIAACQVAAQAYRGLTLALRNQGLAPEASTYRLRGRQIEAHRLFLEHKFGQGIFVRTLGWLTGYGERPWTAVLLYFGVMAGFAIVYYLMGRVGGVPDGGIDAIIFSVLSFHGRGFFPSERVGLHDPLTIVAALEAIVGLFIEIALVASITRWFLGD
jgi:hypothetical protein